MAILSAFPVGNGESPAPFWQQIQAWKSAGTYTWTAPDLFGGKPYYIGVVVIGGGGGGCALISTGGVALYGGASGRASFGILKVQPGSTHTVKIGAGGSGFNVTNSDYLSGGDGDASAFDSITADGGQGGLHNNAPAGGQGPYIPMTTDDVTPYGGIIRHYQSNMTGITCRGTYPAECMNPFTLKPILAAGGTVTGGYMVNRVIQKSVTLSNGRTSASVYLDSAGSVSATRGTLPGCGGGAALVNANASTTSSSATSASGCDGAVYLYIMEV